MSPEIEAAEGAVIAMKTVYFSGNEGLFAGEPD
jgi:hypothetical protein